MPEYPLGNIAGQGCVYYSHNAEGRKNTMFFMIISFNFRFHCRLTLIFLYLAENILKNNSQGTCILPFYLITTWNV